MGRRHGITCSLDSNRIFMGTGSEGSGYYLVNSMVVSIYIYIYIYIYNICGIIRVVSDVDGRLVRFGRFGMGIGKGRNG